MGKARLFSLDFEMAAIILLFAVGAMAVVPPANTSLCSSVPVIPTGWFAGRGLGPAMIHTLAELQALGKYVAPILYGGVGNELFQLAALHVYARSIK